MAAGDGDDVFGGTEFEAFQRHVDDVLGGLQRSLIWRWALVVVMLTAVAIFTIILQVESFNQNQHIQAQRYQTAYGNCLDTRSRHDATIAQLNRQFKAYEAQATPVQLAQLKASEAGTKLLIDDLAPRFSDCRARATAQVRGQR